MRVLELGRGALERGQRLLVAPGLARGIGDAPVDQLGSAGKLGADLAHAIAEADHVVEALGRRTRPGAWTDAPRDRCRARASPAPRSDAAAWDGCPRWPRSPRRRTAARRAPRPSASARCCRYTGTAPARGAAPRSRRRVGAGSAPGPGAATRRRSTAARRSAPDRGRSRCRDRRPRCGASRRDRRRAAGAGDRRPGSGAGPPARTARPRADRCAPARSTGATATGAPPAAETAAAHSRHVPPWRSPTKNTSI